MSQQQTAQISQLFAAGRFAEADKLCRVASKRDPRNSVLPTIRGAIRLKLGDSHGALEFLNRAVELDPRNATAYFNLGVAYRNLLQFEKALESFRNAMNLAGPSASVLNAIGLTELSLGRSAEAASTLAQAVKRDARAPMLYLNLAEALKAAGDLDRAASTLVAALDLEPNFVEALNSLGAIYSQLGNVTEAENHYRRALALSPKHAMVHNNLGVLLRNQGRHAEALAEFEAAIESEPGYAMAHFNRGGLLRESGRPGEALVALKRSLFHRPNLGEAHVASGWIYFERGSLNQARESFNRAIEIKSDDGEAFTGLGEVHKKEGAWSKAKESFTRAIELDGKNSAALHGLGQSLMRLEKLPAAEACFRNALKLQPDSPAVRLALAKVLIDLGKLDEAEACGRELIAANPDFSEAHFVLAKVLSKKTKLDEAASHYSRALAGNQASPSCYLNLAELLHRLGREDERQALLAKLNDLARAPGADAALQPALLSTLAEAADDLSYLQEALSLASKSGHSDGLGFHALLKPGLSLSERQATSLLDAMNRLDASGPGTQMFYRARSVLRHELQDYASSWADLSLANRLVLEGLESRSEQRRDTRERSLREAEDTQFALASGEVVCRPVFIFGVSRSGKSSVEKLLRGARAWTAMDEYPIVEETFRDLQFSHEMMFDPDSLAKSRVDFAVKFAERCKLYGDGVLSFTAPTQIQFAKFLSETLPGARFLFVKRNETDLLFRCLQRTYRRGNLYSYDIKQCATYVRWYTQMIDALAAKLQDRGRVVLYEDLVVNTSAIVVDLWNWLGTAASSTAELSLPDDIGCSRPYHDAIVAELR